MSRIGKLPITILDGVTVDVKDNTITVKGPKDELSLVLIVMQNKVYIVN